MVCPWTDTHLSTNLAECRPTSLMRLMTLRLSQTTTMRWGLGNCNKMGTECTVTCRRSGGDNRDRHLSQCRWHTKPVGIFSLSWLVLLVNHGQPQSCLFVIYVIKYHVVCKICYLLLLVCIVKCECWFFIYGKMQIYMLFVYLNVPPELSCLI